MVLLSKHAILAISCFSFCVFQINMQPTLGLQPRLVLTMVAIHDNGAQANSYKCACSQVKVGKWKWFLRVVFGCGSRSDRGKGIGFY